MAGGWWLVAGGWWLVADRYATGARFGTGQGSWVGAAVRSAVPGLTDAPDVAAPPLVLYSFLLGGPLSVTALSVWEVRRLSRRHGVTPRSALGR
ncbi:hypothetical protein JNUCC64_07940 [Streptomyces sp. JNUCC 64]